MPELHLTTSSFRDAAFTFPSLETTTVLQLTDLLSIQYQRKDGLAKIDTQQIMNWMRSFSLVEQYK